MRINRLSYSELPRATGSLRTELLQYLGNRAPMANNHHNLLRVFLLNLFHNTVNVRLFVGKQLDLQQIGQRCGGLNCPLELGCVDGADADVLQDVGELLRLSFPSGRQDRVIGVVNFVGVPDNDNGALSETGQ